MSKSKSNKLFPYIHGFSEIEQERLRKQAEFAEYTVFQDINFSSTEEVLEVGCGVGAQSEILLRRFPNLNLTSIDLNEAQLEAAKNSLREKTYYADRWTIEKMDAANLEYESNSYDGAFLCWVLEHVPDPLRVLSEVRRVVKPNGKIFITEVMNSSFFLEPYSPNVWKYWMAFNDYQFENAGDPFVGAKLGNFLTALGYSQIRTRVKTWHLDNRNPKKRKEIIDFWSELMLSAADSLLRAERVDEATVKAVKSELNSVTKDPNSVFFYSFMQAEARVNYQD